MTLGDQPDGQKSEGLAFDEVQNILLVEGSDDYNFINAFMDVHGLDSLCQIINCSGINELLKSLKVRIKFQTSGMIGIVVDADNEPTDRWASIWNIVKASGYDMGKVARKLSGEQVIIKSPDLPKLGVWVMPDNQSIGMIEDFAVKMIGDNDDLWPLANVVVDSISETQRRFRPSYTIKAKIHTWLAWQQEPGKPMGLALRKRYFESSTESSLGFADWLRKLFDDGAVNESR